MKKANAKSASTETAISITQGLAELAQTFHERNIPVAGIGFEHGMETYEYIVTNTASDQIVGNIEGRFEGIIIRVSLLSRIGTQLNAEFQTLTTKAATAALGWTKPATHLTLLKSPPPVLTEMLGVSDQMMELTADIERAARSTHVVLILGESGTGKTTAAYMIHERSTRGAKPFIDVNCAAIPDALIESELFGYEKGAFTGAIASKQGLFELADQGTIFLDEIGELKLELQAKLLTAIERQKIRRLGGTKEIKCNLRIIAASSRNLERMVKEGKFREDLYYRLSVLEVSIAPLRDRRDDIPLLIRERLVHEQQLAGLKAPIEIEDGAIRELTVFQWPGNIRELHNVIARLVTRVEYGAPITRAAAQKEIARFVHESINRPLLKNEQSVFLPTDCCVLFPGESLPQFTARVKRTLIETVRRCTGSMKATSVRLDVERTALCKLMSRLRDNKPDGRVKRRKHHSADRKIDASRQPEKPQSPISVAGGNPV
jgi:transcriptional regulator with PAS, ATPase and Fis domain